MVLTDEKTKGGALGGGWELSLGQVQSEMPPSHETGRHVARMDAGVWSTGERC